MNYNTMTVSDLRTLCRSRAHLVGAWIASATKSALVNALETDDAQRARAKPKVPVFPGEGVQNKVKSVRDWNGQTFDDVERAGNKGRFVQLDEMNRLKTFEEVAKNHRIKTMIDRGKDIEEKLRTQEESQLQKDIEDLKDKMIFLISKLYDRVSLIEEKLEKQRELFAKLAE